MITSEFQTRTSSNCLFSNYCLHCVAIVLVTVLWASCLQAAEMTWTNEAGGNFQAAGNWDSNTVPGAADLAVFNVTAAPYTVTSLHGPDRLQTIPSEFPREQLHGIYRGICTA